MTLVLEWFAPPPALRLAWLGNPIGTRAARQNGDVTIAVIIGPPGAAGRDAARFDYLQNVPSSTWLVVHNLGAFPSVTLLEPGGEEFLANVNHLDANVLEVLFTFPTTGRAVLLA